MTEMKKVSLILEDGTCFEGKSFGYDKSVAGEVVFYTAMVGYTESLTDPSYTGQILVSTYPLIGNYGVPSDQKKDGMCEFYESEKIQASGLIVEDYSAEYSHWNAAGSLGQWLKKWKVPGITGIDTRALTKILREKGSMLGKIEIEGDSVDFYDPNKENLVAKAGCNKSIEYGDGDYTVALIDCGVKNNIIRHLIKRNMKVIRVPWNYDVTKENYDGLFISNGPGDPTMCAETIDIIKKAIKIGKPIMGICLGNQLLALAAGGTTSKLKYGHRSHNQPVLRVGTNRCFITPQNHGYVVDTDSLPDDWESLYINVNDGTNEGIKHKTKPFFSTQFHPEASSGPEDTNFLFDEFKKEIVKYKKG